MERCSTKQTVTVIDGSFLQDVDNMLYNNSNSKISMIEVTFDDVFEADIASNSTGADGSRGTVISLWIWGETTNGMHIFDKIDTTITWFIELSGKILLSKLGVADLDTESKTLVLEYRTLKIEGTPDCWSLFAIL